ncbi:hypothetical protein [Mucisphaera calidilacus]|uniref:Sugar ABC transporter substrate-binding protein n=1 Tax=Mucisphaera calidilacus TaxID=2527982 RepID=A0A518BUB3_9BACT|nr:hypothetical protein [Mucisphaera calidilacus]QDU70585.1 hypothetical protein Pan265_04130 [Mucisphaera calidilacus]
MKNVLLFLTVLLALTLTATSAMAKGKVLVVQSYHAGYAWVDDINAGIDKALAGSGIEKQVFFMDTKRRSSADWKVESGR